MYVYIYICVYAYTYIYIYVYVHIFKAPQSGETATALDQKWICCNRNSNQGRCFFFTFSIALCRSNENSVKFFTQWVGRRMFVRLILRCSYCNSSRVSEIGYVAIPFLMSAFTSAHFGIIAILHDRFVLVRPENNSKYGYECRKHLQISSKNQVICQDLAY